jgi:hypothetical protein
MPHRSSEQALRFQSVVLGTGITLGPVAALALGQFLLAPFIMTTFAGTDPKDHVWAVSTFRRQLGEFYFIVGSAIVACWLITAALGRGELLKIRRANIALALAGFAFASSMAIASFVPTQSLFKIACPPFGLADIMPASPPGTFGFDLETPCQAFAAGAERILHIVLQCLALALLATSAILRIVVSRRH